MRGRVLAGLNPHRFRCCAGTGSPLELRSSLPGKQLSQPVCSASLFHHLPVREVVCCARASCVCSGGRRSLCLGERCRKLFPSSRPCLHASMKDLQVIEATHAKRSFTSVYVELNGLLKGWQGMCVALHAVNDRFSFLEKREKSKVKEEASSCTFSHALWLVEHFPFEPSGYQWFSFCLF